MELKNLFTYLKHNQNLGADIDIRPVKGFNLEDFSEEAANEIKNDLLKEGCEIVEDRACHGYADRRTMSFTTSDGYRISLWYKSDKAKQARIEELEEELMRLKGIDVND